VDDSFRKVIPNINIGQMAATPGKKRWCLFWSNGSTHFSEDHHDYYSKLNNVVGVLKGKANRTNMLCFLGITIILVWVLQESNTMLLILFINGANDAAEQRP
jgi:hypothetical protein